MPPDAEAESQRKRNIILLNRILAGVVLVEIFIFPIVFVSALLSGNFVGEFVTNAVSSLFGRNATTTLSQCATIPADWRGPIDQAGSQSGASPALIAAILSGGEHYSWYTTKKWPAYESKYEYGSEMNPAIHHSNQEGFVRGPAQFKERTFEAYSPQAKQNGLASRFGGGFKVEPFIEETQPAITATGAYLKGSGARIGANDDQIKKAIYAYNHADWYVERVFRVYQEYLSCSQTVQAAGGSDGVPLLKQWDPKWGSVDYGYGETIRTSGCGLTAVAMVLQYYGVAVSPDILARESLNNGHRIEKSGTAHSFIPFIAQKYSLQSESQLSWEEAMNHLRAGKPVIVSGTGPEPFTENGHFVVLTKVNGDRTIGVNDPARGTGQNTPYPEDHIKRYNTRFRGIIYR